MILFEAPFGRSGDACCGFVRCCSRERWPLSRAGQRRRAPTLRQRPRIDLNNVGDVGFAASLDTDVNNDGLPDSGLYVASHGSLHLVARTGTVLPGLGTIAYLGSAPVVPSIPLATGGELNNRRQILLYATLTNGRGALLLATPAH